MSSRAKVAGRNWFAIPSARGRNEPLMRRDYGRPSASWSRKRGSRGADEKSGSLRAGPGQAASRIAPSAALRVP